MSFKRAVQAEGFDTVNELSLITGIEVFTLRNRWKADKKEWRFIVAGARALKSAGEVIAVNIPKMELERVLADD